MYFEWIYDIYDFRNTKENNKTRQSIVKNNISREEENYVRMNLLLCGISSRAVRALFDSVFDSSSLHTSLSEAYNTLKELKSKRKINQLQWNLLFPYNGKYKRDTQGSIQQKHVFI